MFVFRVAQRFFVHGYEVTHPSRYSAFLPFDCVELRLFDLHIRVADERGVPHHNCFCEIQTHPVPREKRILVRYAMPEWYGVYNAVYADRKAGVGSASLVQDFRGTCEGIVEVVRQMDKCQTITA